jgi:uncharacterized damage-inducible protein DinB
MHVGNSQLHPFVAGVASSLDFGHRWLQGVIKELTPEQLAALPTGFHNSIATLVVHIAGSEIYYAHRLMKADVPDNLKREYLLDKPLSPLPVAVGETPESLTAKLTTARQILLAAVAKVSEADLDREADYGPDQQGIRWVLSLLPNHQAIHLGQVLLVRQHI